MITVIQSTILVVCGFLVPGSVAMSESKVFLFDNSDPEMQRAYENARASFRYFWREIAWERRRIIPALDLACVKAPFSDGDDAPRDDDMPSVEHMWMSDVDFDGQFVSGVLINSPNWLKTVKEGNAARIPLGEISDWMYAISGEVFGAYTVNLLRSRMGRQERQEHDEAWGLNFGDPTKIRVAPEPKKGGGLLAGWFGKKPTETQEHPMSENMAASLQAELAKNPAMISASDENGWTLLHQEALVGSAPTVKILLAAGADRNVKTRQGHTPLQLAQSLGWENVVVLLMGK
jgi:uncharacterized protein YegJ (DUF2314 family)